MNTCIMQERDLKLLITLIADILVALALTFSVIFGIGVNVRNLFVYVEDRIPCTRSSCFLHLVPRFRKTKPLKTLWFPKMLGNAHRPSSSSR